MLWNSGMKHNYCTRLGLSVQQKDPFAVQIYSSVTKAQIGLKHHKLYCCCAMYTFWGKYHDVPSIYVQQLNSKTSNKRSNC